VAIVSFPVAVALGAVYAKLLVTEGDVHRPDPKNMTPKTKALFDLLFPE
jgi:hypothetical protein